MEVEEGTGNGGGTEFRDGTDDKIRIGVSGNSDVSGPSSVQSEGLRTYKRRKRANSSADGQSEEKGTAIAKEASQTVQQPPKESQGVAHTSEACETMSFPVNCSDGCSERSWKIVLEHMYQSLSDDKGSLQRCIGDVLLYCPDTGTKAKESAKPDVNQPPQKENSGNPDVSLSMHTATEMCRHAWFHILISDKFTSLCKLLSENFQGIKTESFFDLKLLNKRMKEGDYDHSPMLFLTDIQQVWEKIQGIGAQMISLANDLSDISKSCYDKQFCNLESDSHTKPEQGEVNRALRVTCRICSEKPDGRDFLVCDSCEEMFHLSCIEPPLKEIPHQSWYCSCCTESGIRWPHVNCVVCERLNCPKTAVGIDNDGSCAVEEETLNELGDEAIQLLSKSSGLGLCKICERQIEEGEKMRICGHNLCARNLFHVRCLTKSELKSHGPCWYCPSCLCRTCLDDKDDDQIVLCDGCDHGYHIYCTEPKMTQIPSGSWYCNSCDSKRKQVEKARKAYERYEAKQKTKVNEGLRVFGALSKNWNSKSWMEQEKRGGMEMLLTAVNTLSYEEKLGRCQTG